MPKRHNRRPRSGTPEALAGALPAELRSFDRWHYTAAGQPTGLSDYTAALSDYATNANPADVMNAAGLSAADWYRAALSRIGADGL